MYIASPDAYSIDACINDGGSPEHDRGEEEGEGLLHGDSRRRIYKF